VEKYSRYGMMAARILISMVFLLNAFGVIDQSVPAHEMAARGAPAGMVPLLMMSGRAIQLLAGIGLMLGVFPRLSAVALLAFLIPATFIAHSFWLATGTPTFMGQLINFSKNTAMCGGLLFVAATAAQPAMMRLGHTK
jgi:putative oxidoreductase